MRSDRCPKISQFSSNTRLAMALAILSIVLCFHSLIATPSRNPQPVELDERESSHHISYVVRDTVLHHVNLLVLVHCSHAKDVLFNF